MDPLGKSPIPVPILVLGKVSMFVGWLFFFAGYLDVAMLYDAIWSRLLGSAMAMGGIVVVVLGLRDCGNSVSVGLPREKTELKTGGIYSCTRNPMYLGGFIVSAGSCFFSIHPVNFLLFLTTFAVHHASAIFLETEP